MADDATNTTLAQLGEQETIWAVADALRGWMERYGVPMALYVDWKNWYKRPADHPWRVAARREAQQKALRELMTRPSLAWPSASP